MRYTLYNVTGTLKSDPCKIATINARDYDDAFIKSKELLCKGIREQLGLIAGTKIAFTPLKQDLELGYGDKIMYTTCSLEDNNGFVIDTYEYGIAIGG